MRRILLQQFWWSTRNRFFPPGTFPYKATATVLFCLTVCLALFFVSCKVITYFHSQNELGIILSLKIFQMSWIILFAMLVFSCMVSAVSSLFLSQDNEIIFAAPVDPAEIYFMRYITTSFYTSWMMIAFSLPIFAAYGQVFQVGIYYWPLIIAAVLATAATATCLGMLVTIFLVNIFPARRTKDIVLYLSLCFGILLYILFRLMRPEDLVNPDKYGHFIEYLSSVSTPAGPYVPAAWASNLLTRYILDRQTDWLLLGLMMTSPLSLFFIGEWAMQRWFFSGFSKSQESFGGFQCFKNLGSYDHKSWRWIFRKETKVFLRDSTEWSQLFMIGALIIVYLYNFKILPVERSPFQEEYITNLIAFLNIGLAGFMVASLSARFVFPSVGAEGGSFYIIQSSPLPIKRYLFHKYLFYVIPLTCFSLLLVIISDKLLKIEGPMWWFSIATITIITWTVVALALGFGSIYADFKAENKASALGGFGAILFLFTAMTFELIIIFLGAFPAYRLVKKWVRGIPLPTNDIIVLGSWIFFSIFFATAISFYFFNKGIKKLEDNG